MPDDTAASKFNEKTLEAFLEGLLDELKHPQDAKLLEDVRRAFRKKVPFHLRSYASALMILRAAGISRPKAPRRPAPESGARVPAASEKPRSEPRPDARSEPSARDSTSLFVSMGKRHHLKPLELKQLISERAGVPAETLGRVHLLENYSFIEVHTEATQRIIAAMEGSELNGRPLEIKPAKKRSESTTEGQ